MNRNGNKIQIKKYSLEDAFNIINIIINEEREKYENIIKTMNQKISELKLEISQLKEENKNYKNKIFQFQNHFYSISKTFFQLNEIPQNKMIYEKNKIPYSNSKKKNQKKTIKNDLVHKINLNENINFNNNDIMYNNSINLKQSNINNNDKDSINQQLFNQKLFKKIDTSLESPKKMSQSFNSKISGYNRFIKRNYNFYPDNYSQTINDLNDNYIKEQNKTLNAIRNDRKRLENDIQYYTYKKNNTQKEKFSIIEKRIKNMKNGLTIYRNCRKKFNKEDNESFKTKYDSFSIHNRGNLLNYDNHSMA